MSFEFFTRARAVKRRFTASPGAGRIRTRTFGSKTGPDPSPKRTPPPGLIRVRMPIVVSLKPRLL